MKIDRINNYQTPNNSFKGYVHKSVYQTIENSLVEKARKLRKNHYTFSNIPTFELNILKEQKNNLVTTLNKLDVVMNQNYHKQTFIIPVTDSCNKDKKQLVLANELLPGITLPIIKKSNYWLTECFVPHHTNINSIVTNLTAPDTIKTNESDLLEAWVQKKIKGHCSNSLLDKIIRKIISISAEKKATLLDISNVDISEIIKTAVTKHEQNNKNKISEKDFMNSLKFNK